MGRVKSVIRDEKAILKESPKGPKKVILSYLTKAFSLKYINILDWYLVLQGSQRSPEIET